MRKILQKSAKYEPRGRLDPKGFEQHIGFKMYLPPADLVPFVERFWAVCWHDIEGTYYSEEVMHRPYVDIFVAPGKVGVQGTFRGKRAYEAAGSGKIVGVRLLPGVFHTLWAGDMSELQDEMKDMEELFPNLAHALSDNLLALPDEVAVDKLTQLIHALNPKPDLNIKLLDDIISTIETDANLKTVSGVANAFGKSERWLQQLFQEYIGVGLQWLLKRRRLLEAAEVIRQSDTIPSWAIIAYDLGYSSQQHFIGDFKKVTGKTPLQYYRQNELHK